MSWKNCAHLKQCCKKVVDIPNRDAHGNSYEWTLLDRFRSYLRNFGLQSIRPIISTSERCSCFVVKWQLKLSTIYLPQSSALKDIIRWLSRTTVHSFDRSPFKNSRYKEDFYTIGSDLPPSAQRENGYVKLGSQRVCSDDYLRTRRSSYKFYRVLEIIWRYIISSEKHSPAELIDRRKMRARVTSRTTRVWTGRFTTKCYNPTNGLPNTTKRARNRRKFGEEQNHFSWSRRLCASYAPNTPFKENVVIRSS